ncbi:MAG TPA: NUDIX domain-containing protein, partial [Burkholderiales bacterium]|nr:NUDIX domain-containing protein [Burkholderiales bacterium]
RETEEETGLSGLEFSWGEGFIETSPYGKPPKIARYHLAKTEREEIDLPVSAELGRPEHDEWRWVNFIEAEKLLSPRLRPVLSWARKKLE